jgi:hypothetical protein
MTRPGHANRTPWHRRHRLLQTWRRASPGDGIPGLTESRLSAPSSESCNEFTTAEAARANPSVSL